MSHLLHSLHLFFQRKKFKLMNIYILKISALYIIIIIILYLKNR
nr:MAG TPA: hypothetical protein [Caudoviricetes sp.]